MVEVIHDRPHAPVRRTAAHPMTLPIRSTPVRLAAFAALLVVAFGAAFGLGAVIDPTSGEARSGGHAQASHADGADDGSGHGAGRDGAAPAHDGTHASGAGHAASAATTGLQAAQDGLRLAPERTRATAGRAGTYRFRIEDAAGRAVRAGYELESERELHLIVVRRDGRGFQHLHPRRAADGTWSTPLTLSSGGSHRVLADFVVDGTRRVLGVDLEASGDYRPAPPAAPARAAEVDGLRVALDGAPRAARESTLRFRVTTAGGHPVLGLQPYLGARGHLVALREGDLSYLHVHPVAAHGGGEDDAAADHGHAGDAAAHHHESAPDASSSDHDGTTTHLHEDGTQHVHGADGAGGSDPDGAIAFAATFPDAGRHRLYLQFRIAGVVRTVPFVVDVAR